MTWECSECGELVEQERRPIGCPHCGLAGVFFTEAPEEDTPDEDGGTLGYWFKRGASMSDYAGPASFWAPNE